MDESLEFSHACGICGGEWRLERTNMAQIELMMTLIQTTHVHTVEEAAEYIKAASMYGMDDD